MWRPTFSDCTFFSVERVQVVLGLPFGLFHYFRRRPIAAFTARWWSMVRFEWATWPNKPSLLSATSSNAETRSVLTLTSMLVCLVYGIHSMRRKHCCLKASNFLRIMSVVIQVSQPYRRTGTIYALYSRNLVTVLMEDLEMLLFRNVKHDLAISIRRKMSDSPTARLFSWHPR